MKRYFLVYLFVIVSVAAFSQARNLVNTYGNVYRSYVFPEIKDTPAPEGFEPMYISHIGRHGSRYPVDTNYVKNAMRIMQTADSLGLLKPRGREFMKCFQHLDEICQGMYGMLCERGIEELGTLGSRMASRYGMVFQNKQRNELHVMATEKPRAILSGGNFVANLTTSFPGLKVNYIAGPKYTILLCNDVAPQIGKNNGKTGRICDEYLDKHFPYDTFLGKFFENPDEVFKYTRKKRIMVEGSWVNATVAEALGYPDMLDFLSEEEYKQGSIAYANKMYAQHCNGKVAGSWRVHFLDDLLKDFIQKADVALTDGSKVAADLRFSHDTGMMPFFGLIGLKSYEKAVDFDEGHKVWNPTELMCMASNLQMIFYKNKAGKVLVKFLMNEKETSLPKVKPVVGPYYDWKDVKKYWTKRLNSKS